MRSGFFAAWLLLQGAAAPPPGPSPTPALAVLDRIAAVVGDEIVLESEVRQLYEVGLMPRRPGETDAAYRDRILEQRIVDLLRERELRRMGEVSPDPREIEETLKALAERVEKERGEPFARVLERSGVTRAEVVEWIRRGLALQAFVRERISPTIKTTEAELKAYYDGPFRQEARERGIASLPPYADVQDQVRELLRERKLNEAIERWTEELRRGTRTLIYRR